MFCTFYLISANEKEAAEKAGFSGAEKKGAKLLKKKEIKNYIAEIEKQQKSDRNNIANGYKKLAFGCNNDAIELLFTEEITGKRLKQLDLFNISEIKKKNDGGIEIKFFDRIEALEKLSELCSSQSDESLSGNLYSAIAASAEAIKKADEAGI